MINSTPPSHSRQNWAFIISVSGVIWVISFLLSLTFVWNWIGDLSPIKLHAEYWVSPLKALFVDVGKQNWTEYWAFVNRNGLRLELTFYFLFALSVATFAAYLIVKRLYVDGGQSSYFHVNGPQLFQFKTALQHALRKAKEEASPLGLKLHPKLQISKRRESGNVLVLGNQGTGKTVFILSLIEQVIKRGERVFIYDEKREFTAQFFDEATTVLIAPWDKRGTAWNIQADAHNAVLAKLIADQLIPDSKDPLWSEGARSIFAGMITILNRTKEQWGWVELANMMLLDESKLRVLLGEYYPRAQRFIVEESKTTQSFFAQLDGSLGWIHTLAEAWPKAFENGFSMKEWVEDPNSNKPIIIVQADKRYKDIGAPVANTLIRLMTSHILSQTNCLSRELWLFIDELANLPKNEALGEWMSLGRSKGCRICGGTQSISQLKEIYSDNGADTLLNMFTIFASMRLGAAGETAPYTAKVFGERVVERRTSSAGPTGNASQNWHGETVPIVRASDLVHLPQPDSKGVVGYILIPGYKAVYKLRWPYPKIPMLSEEHCPADWVNNHKSQSIEKTESTMGRSRLESVKNKRAKS